MEYRQLGRTGLGVGVIGLGTEHLEQRPEVMDEVLSLAVDAGSNYVDLLATACDGYAEVGMMTMAVDADRWDGWAQESLALLQRYKDSGRIGHIGASGHDPLVALRAVESGADAGPYLALYDACRERGVGLVAMKVYAGGTLLVLDGRPTGITPAQCLAYVLSLPLAAVVPGPRNVEEWLATLAYLEASAEERQFQGAIAALPQTLAGHCVYCDHCLPCPEGIAIGTTLTYADWAAAGVTADLKDSYAKLPAPASACTECGVCNSRCPFKVDVPERIRAAAALYEGWQ
ncbi:MAG: 4Fe-4S dicluster domain-containing protein [Anaerolineae bacterium]